MKKSELGMPLKYFLVMPFVLLLFANDGNGQTVSGTDESAADKKIVACQYGLEEIEIFGNLSCSKMFCAVWSSSVECTYENGEKEKLGLLCPALKNSEGGWTCPGAYDCAVAETPEYDEAIKDNTAIIYDPHCEGAGILNMTSGVFKPSLFLEDTFSTPPPDPVTNPPSVD